MEKARRRKGGSKEEPAAGTGWPLAIGLGVVAAYAAFVGLYALDLPQEDDLPALVAFVLRFPGAGWTALLQRHNEHVVAWARLAAWLQAKLWGGRLSMLALVLVGQLLLIPLYNGLRQTMKGLSKGRRALLALPMLCLVFNPQYQVTSLWALGVWSNILVLILAWVALDRLGRKQYPTATLVALAATLANGNGIAVFAAGGLVLLLQRAPARGWLLWAAGGMGGYAVLAYSLSHSPTNATQTFEVLAPASVPLSLVAFHGSALALLGGKLDAILTLTAGTLALAMAAFYLFKTAQDSLARQPLPRHAAVLLGMFAFVAASGLAVALFRAEKGLDVVTGARYRHYGCLALALAYAMAQHRLPASARPRVAWIATAVCLAMLALAYPRQIAYRLPFAWRLQADAYNLAYNRNFPQLIASGFDSTYSAAVSAKVLAAPPRLGPFARQHDSATSELTSVVDNKGADHFICRHRFVLRSVGLPLEARVRPPAFAALIGEHGDTTVFPAEGRFSYVNWLGSLAGRPHGAYKPGALASLYDCGLHGRYRLGWIVGRELWLTGDTVTAL